MRQVLVICAFLIQLFGYLQTDANPCRLGKAEMQDEQPEHLLSSFQEDRSADLVHAPYFVCNTLKLGDQRLVAGVMDWVNSRGLFTSWLRMHSTISQTPLYLPLIRLLLFPKHYFW